jgi:hypothetical protein
MLSVVVSLGVLRVAVGGFEMKEIRKESRNRKGYMDKGGSNGYLPNAGGWTFCGLHLVASSISFPTRMDPAIPIPSPSAAPVTAAVF